MRHNIGAMVVDELADVIGAKLAQAMRGRLTLMDAEVTKDWLFVSDAVDAILKRSGDRGDKFSELVLAIVESEPFRFRRGREPAETER